MKRESIFKKILLTACLGVGVAPGVLADSAAAYPGGEKAMQEFIVKTMKYPAPAKANGVEGVITLNLTVGPDGKIGAIKIVRMVDPDLEQEAIRIVKLMPAWTPAEKEGQAVESQVQIPVSFNLGD